MCRPPPIRTQAFAREVFRGILTEGGIIALEEPGAHVNHIGSDGPVIGLALVAAHNHVIDSVAMTINAIQAGPQMHVHVRMPPGIAQARFTGVAIVTGGRGRTARDLQQHVIVRVEFCAVVFDRRHGGRNRSARMPLVGNAPGAAKARE